MEPTTPATWDGVRSHLARTIRSLQHKGFVVVGEPPGTPRRVGLLRRTEHPPTRYVQLLRVDDELHAECVGTTAVGGPLEVSLEVAARLLSWGWMPPGDARGVSNYAVTAQVTDAERLADLGTRTLELLGLRPDDLVWTVETTG